MIRNKEVWRDIEGYEGLYLVSNYGRIKSHDKLVYCGHKGSEPQMKQSKIRKLQISKKGYHTIILSKDGIATSYLVHRLVAKAFIINPNKLPQVNHKDEDKLNNNVDNLEWCTNLYNARYGTVYRRRIDAMKKVINKYTLDGEFISQYDSAKDVGIKYNHGTNGIYRCCNGFQESAHGYKWRYADEINTSNQG